MKLCINKSFTMTSAMVVVLASTWLAGMATASLPNLPMANLANLPYDENGKLTTHYLLYPAQNAEGCGANNFRLPREFQGQAISGDAQRILFPDFTAGGCRAVCVERGVDQSLVQAVLPHRFYDSATITSSFADWFLSTCQRVEVCIMNYHNADQPINLYWLQEITGQPLIKKLHATIGYGEKHTRCFNSFVGHQFQAEDSVTGEDLGHLTIISTMTFAFGQSPPSGDPQGRTFDQEIEKTLHNEWDRHNRVKRTFSPLGFKLGRLPDDVFASMGAFYYNNRLNKVNEEWHGKGVFVNWWDSNCSFIQIPWDLKRIWAERLRLLVEAWAGVPVEQTSLYGLRQYEAGARLLTHVDREKTHAVSLIVNVAQGNMSEPWPVEVHDHADRLHEVIMAPGDIVYYESAKCLHGRNRPLRGENAYYVNLFTHYRPIGDEAWLEKPNHEGTPDPVLEVSGTCHLANGAASSMASDQVGKVQCDDPRLGPFVSPSLFTAHSGAELYEWWRNTAPGVLYGSAGAREEL